MRLIVLSHAGPGWLGCGPLHGAGAQEVSQQGLQVGMGAAWGCMSGLHAWRAVPQPNTVTLQPQYFHTLPLSSPCKVSLP